MLRIKPSVHFRLIATSCSLWLEGGGGRGFEGCFVKLLGKRMEMKWLVPTQQTQRGLVVLRGNQRGSQVVISAVGRR